MEEFSVVSCSYRPHAGMLGIVGPLWMDYGRSMSTVSYIAGRLETLLVHACSRAPGGIRDD